MLKIIQHNKAVIRFLLWFGGSYLILALLDKLFLVYGLSENYYPEIFTYLVAEQSRALIESMGYVSSTFPHPFAEGIALTINEEIIVRVIEGCNGISVIILFFSFVLAFGKKWKPVLLFSLAGASLIHVLNVTRIALLTIGIYEYPEYESLLHEIVFPAVIYGVVFLLWVLWTNYVLKQSKK